MSSLSQPKYKQEHDSSTQNAISNLIDIINDNNLSVFYDNSESNFKRNIDQLNLKFYLETEKILSPSNKCDKGENQNRLFLILFKQINLYIKEIERLNTVIIKMNDDPQCIKKKMELISKQKDTFETKELLIQTLKNSISSLEKRLGQVMISENAFRTENEQLKKELQYYKDKENNTSVFFSNSNANTTSSFNISSQFIRKNKRTYSDNNQSALMNVTNIKKEKEHRTKGRSPNILNPKLFHNNNSKLKIIKAVKSKMSYSSSKKQNQIDDYTNDDNSPILNSPRINCYNLKQSFSNLNCASNNLCSLSFNKSNHDDSINELSQIETLLIEIKEHLTKNETKKISIDLAENDNINQIEVTPHFSKVNINDYINGACIQ